MTATPHMRAVPDRQILVVGNGMVGHRFVELAAAIPGVTVTVLGEEPRTAYDRVHLSDYFTDISAGDLALRAAPPTATVHVGERVTGIDRESRTVRTDAGRRVGYDTLVLATGSYPFVPPIDGRDRPHCHVYRTIEDLDAIRASGTGAKTGVVIGGGLLGLEAANALKNMALATHVVEFAPGLMGTQLDDGGGTMLRGLIEDLGVAVHTGKNTLRIVAGEAARHRLEFADGDSLETDLVVFSAGIRPRDELARDCGLTVGERGGIVIDERCRTSDRDILAVGECALYDGRIFGLVAPGYEMAKVAADVLAGNDAAFRGADMSTRLKLLGVDVASIGDAHGRSRGASTYTYIDQGMRVYKRIVVNKTGKKLLGAVLVGDTADYGMLLQTMRSELTLPKHPDTLILPQRDILSRRDGGGMPAGAVAALPDSAQICSCHDVSKGAIVAAVADGATTLGAVRGCTKASTGCGGCGPLVTQLLNAELEARGVAINTDLCEHFAHTRQELYHLVRALGIKSFDALIEKHGRGRGCDICKPAVASILAACWNDHVLTARHAPLQDTNDHFLANMQKDGTYSIVPRVPAGEITPEKLIALGEVAKKYDLYTKVTGGQRIDLFGAQVHELPLIWRELIDAGFETGHAYGKAVRTVKSCVGSTWCRYGVLDSVGMAIAIENRYKGLRAPHKLKFAVSGCTRECAEAQSKDVGVIATEIGWNLYVCGNGGMRPRHADLFATGLDDATLLKLIDRFLMFYIRTADRLQRTSVWMENLEGGLDYLKSVIIDDSLGLGADLESEMAHVVSTYECEWKTTIEDPGKLKRFRTFVNSDQADDSLAFVRERGQRRPARASEVA
ncbi:MAG: nitrite reductase large subunit NirB [Gammaproteobacteria bacterium]|nr:nitrite reductase large subunit NirB [Gammaproteobacteria bacterium]